MTPSKWPEPAERCSVRAELRGDPMLGTAFPAARLLLVEEPFPWGPEGLRTSRFDQATALELEARARQIGVRVQAVRRPGRTPEGLPRRWMLVDTRDGHREVLTGEYEEDAELLDLPLDGSVGEPAPDPLYLVCAHGQHDPCCGQRGRPLVRSLSHARPESVWQASHLGGCRFAPTVLVLPLGLMYGRVPPLATEELIDATERGEVVLDHLRGRIGIPPAAQAAVARAHEELQLARSADVSLVAATAVDSATVAVRVSTAHGTFDVTVQRTRIDAAGLTCGSPGPSWFVAHTPVAFEPAGDEQR